MSRLTAGLLWVALGFLGCSASAARESPPGNDSAVKAGSDAGFNVEICSTTITGKVMTGSKLSPDPLFNVTVFIPAEPVEEIVDGVACERCGSIKTRFLAATKTDATGYFELHGIEPGKATPLVMQIGRWRRQVEIPAVKRCSRTEIPTTLTRMPRNRKEGHIPKIAIGTGGADALECLLQRVGIDESEFTHPWEAGRVHIFRISGSFIDGETPAGELLYDWPKHLDEYDIVLLPCEGYPNVKSTVSRQNVIDYTNKGGRVFTTHYGSTWIQDSPDPNWAKAVTWETDTSHTFSANIDMSFPKGKALADWLWNLKVSKTYGTFPISATRDDIKYLNPPTQRWAYSSDGPLQFTFNTPIGAPSVKQCGRVAYSDFHVIDSYTSSTCAKALLEPQERVLEYLLFDLANCIQADSEDPTIPAK